MASIGGVVYGSDYNAVQVKAVQVLGSGSPYGPGTASPNYGYNQALTSSTVAVAAIITHNQFQLLADDVNKAYFHQTGANFAGYSASYAAIGAAITAADLNLLDTTINTCINSRLTAASTQLSNTTSTYTRTTAWGAGATGITQTGTFTFASAAAMQYYFNQGGKIVFQGFFTSPTASTQDTVWKTLTTNFTYTLNAQAFNGDPVIPLVGLTATPTIKFSASSGTALYTGNYINLSLSVSGAVITYTVLYQDGHAATGAGPDSVSATVGMLIYPYTSTGVIVGTAPTIAVTAGSTFV